MGIDPRQRLGVYCPGAGTGGPWRYVHSVLAGLDPAEFAVTLFCHLPGDYPGRPDVRVVPLGGPTAIPGGATATAPPPTPPRPSRRLIPPAARLWAGFARDTRRLARLFRRHPMDLFHTQNTGCEESPMAARLAGVPRVVGTFHVDSTYDLRRERSGPAHRVLEIVSNHCLGTAIAVSRQTGRDWVRRTHLPARRVVTIHNGIDPERFGRRQSREQARRELGLDPRGLVVGGVGRLDEAKGFADLIAAAARLRPEFPDLTVVIAGDGPLRAGLETLADKHGLGGVVRFLGFRSDVQPVFDALDVYAMPSLCEALPYALLEAMASELPTVGSTVGGIPEVIVPGETGLLVPPRSPDRLAAALTEILRSSEARKRMGAAGRRRVGAYFHERDMVRRTLAVYRGGRP